MRFLRGPFADPRFRRLRAGQSLSSFGDTVLYLTLGIWANALTGSNAAAGGVFLALGIPALFAPAAGHLADRVRRRPRAPRSSWCARPPNRSPTPPRRRRPSA